MELETANNQDRLRKFSNLMHAGTQMSDREPLDFQNLKKGFMQCQVQVHVQET